MIGAPGNNYCLNIYIYEVLNFFNGFYYMNSDETWLFSLPVQMYQILPIKLNSCSWNKITRYINFCQPYVTIMFITTLCQIPSVTIIPPCHIHRHIWTNVGNTDIPMSVILYVPACMHIRGLFKKYPDWNCSGCSLGGMCLQPVLTCSYMS